MCDARLLAALPSPRPIRCRPASQEAVGTSCDTAWGQGQLTFLWPPTSSSPRKPTSSPQLSPRSSGGGVGGTSPPKSRLSFSGFPDSFQQPPQTLGLRMPSSSCSSSAGGSSSGSSAPPPMLSRCTSMPARVGRANPAWGVIYSPRRSRLEVWPEEEPQEEPQEEGGASGLGAAEQGQGQGQGPSQHRSSSGRPGEISEAVAALLRAASAPHLMLPDACCSPVRSSAMARASLDSRVYASGCGAWAAMDSVGRRRWSNSSSGLSDCMTPMGCSSEAVTVGSEDSPGMSMELAVPQEGPRSLGARLPRECRLSLEATLNESMGCGVAAGVLDLIQACSEEVV